MGSNNVNPPLRALLIGMTGDVRYLQLVRLGLLSAGLVVAETLFDHLRKVSAAVDVIVVAARKPGETAAAIRSLTAAASPPVVVIAPSAHLADFAAAMAAGASGYLLEGMEPASLGRALACAARGEIVVPRGVVAVVTEQVRADAGSQPVSELDGRLTRREREVLNLLRQGLPTRAIAERLSVTPVTVRSHIVAIVRKLHVADRAAAASLRSDGSTEGDGWPREADLSQV